MVEPVMHSLRVQLVNYDTGNIFNMDEPGLFYRALPSRTYLAYNEIWKKGDQSIEGKRSCHASAVRQR
jgi:hypothetical protein